MQIIPFVAERNIEQEFVEKKVWKQNTHKHKKVNTVPKLTFGERQKKKKESRCYEQY